MPAGVGAPPLDTQLHILPPWQLVMVDTAMCLAVVAQMVTTLVAQAGDQFLLTASFNIEAILSVHSLFPPTMAAHNG